MVQTIKEHKDKNILTSKNILIIFIALLCALFLNSTSGLWMITKIDDNIRYKIVVFVTELIIVCFCFSFLSIIKREYTKVLYLSIIGGLNFTILFLLSQKTDISTYFFPFIHPTTMTLTIPFIYRGNYKNALIGYSIGLFFSLIPLVYSIIPILFFQLLLFSNNRTSNLRLTNFIARLIIYITMSVLFYFIILFFLTDGQIIPRKLVSREFELILGVISLIGLYYSLDRYLKDYYSGLFRNKHFFLYASYVPVIWLIPLFQTLKKRDNE